MTRALTPTEERALVDAALDGIARVLAGDRPSLPDIGPWPGPLADPGATFVTLTRDGALLGCIGTLTAQRPLLHDAAHHAVAAAFADPRMPAITTVDYRLMDVKVSVLSPLQPLAVAGRAELLTALAPGRDGLLVESRYGQATFLPSVWEQLPVGDDFLDALWRKAGWRARVWPDDLRVSTYRTHEIDDPAPRGLRHAA